MSEPEGMASHMPSDGQASASSQPNCNADATPALQPRGTVGWLRAGSALLERQVSDIGQQARFLLTYYSFCYAVYSIGVIAVGTLAYWLMDSNDLKLLDAFFLATSTVTMAGLTPVDFAQTSPGMQVVAFLLFVFGSPMLLTTVPPALRLGCSRRRLHRSRKGSAFFGVATAEADEKLALKVIIRYVLVYWFAVQAVGAFLIWLGFILAGVRAGPWEALFVTTSAFHNCGLLNLKDGLPLKEGFGAVMVLIVLMVLVLLGNTLFPVALRFIIAIRRHCESDEQRRGVLRLLLRYPRTCYTHLFPDYATRWLAIVTPLLILLQIVAMGLADFWAEPAGHPGIRHPASMEGMSWGQRVLATIFLAGTARTGGLSVMHMGQLSPTSAFVLSLCMYISTCPLVVVMRSTVNGPDQKCEIEYGMERTPVANAKIVKEQAKVFMGHDVTVLLLLFFVILLFEEYAGEYVVVYDRFLYVVFEFCSAYGTVGLSLTNGSISRSGSWTSVSKLALIVVMFMGRLRGLPESFDPTVKFLEDSDDEAECNELSSNSFEDEDIDIEDTITEETDSPSKAGNDSASRAA